MSAGHKDPIIWEVINLAGARLTLIVKHTRAEATKELHNLYGKNSGATLRDTGKRKPSGKCCDTCGDVPCEKRK